MIIGLTGPAFSGKDTVGVYLARAHNFSMLAFAEPIREALMAAFAIDPRQFKPDNKETVIDWIGKSPRQLMQTLGTEWGRNLVKQTIWTDLMERRIGESIRAGDSDIVITDVRFWTEATLIARLGGEVWRVERPQGESTDHARHISDTEMVSIPAHRTLTNDGTLEQLYEQIDTALYAVMESVPC